jgi:hypothetical protein
VNKHLFRIFAFFLIISLLLSPQHTSQAQQSTPPDDPLSDQNTILSGFIEEFNQENSSLWQKSNGINDDLSFANAWLPKHLDLINGKLLIRLDKKDDEGKVCAYASCYGREYSSGEIVTSGLANYGHFSTEMKTAKGSGLVNGFFTYEDKNGSRNEIDIELFGVDPTKGQVNYWLGNEQHAKLINLGFDASQNYHDYSFDWLPGTYTTPGFIIWYIDNQYQYHVAEYNLPDRPMHIIANLWGNAGEWTDPGAFPPIENIGLTNPTEYINGFENIKYIPYPTNRANEEFLDVALILDSSGSMKTSDPDDLRKEAARAFIDTMGDWDWATIIDFDDSVKTLWQLLPTVGKKEAIHSAINQIDSSGSTNIGLGLQAGFENLSQMPTRHRKIAILLTDGKGDYADQAAQYAAQGWKIFTIGLGNDINQQLLEQIASETGGKYYFLTSADQLIQKYFEISQSASGAQTLFNLETQLNQGETKIFPVSIPANQSLINFWIHWKGSTVDLSLVDPDGNDILPINADQDPAIYHSKGSTYALFRVTEPKSGTWKIKLYGADLPTSGEKVTTQVISRGTSSIFLPTVMYNQSPPAPVSLSWKYTSNLVQPRYLHASAAWGNYIYVLGGEYNGQAISSIEKATRNNDGSLGSWQEIGTLPEPRKGLKAFVNGDYFYVIGGQNKSGQVLKEVLYAHINSDGSLGSWQTTSPIDGRYNHAAVAANGYVYMIGGVNGTALNSVFYSRINSDGSLNAWQPTSSLITQRQGTDAVTSGSYIYVPTGNNASGKLESVEYAAIQPDGSLGAWKITSPVTTPRVYHTVVSDGNSIFIIGGSAYSSNDSIDSVESASIQTGGSLSSWSDSVALNQDKFGISGIYSGGTVYITGGINISGYLNNVEFGRLR